MKKLLSALLLMACLSAHSAEDGSWLSDQILTDVDGQAHSLSLASQEGKSMVLVFWVPWCGACKKEAPSLVAAARELQNRAIFYGIVPGTDTLVPERKIRTFIKQQKLTYPTLRDPHLDVTSRLKVKGTPMIIVLNANMEITYAGHHSPPDWSAVL